MPPVKILRPVTYVLVSLASICVIVGSVWAYTTYLRVLDSLQQLQRQFSTVDSAPVTPSSAPMGIDADCYAAHPQDWAIECGG